MSLSFVPCWRISDWRIASVLTYFSYHWLKRTTILKKKHPGITQAVGCTFCPICFWISFHSSSGPTKWKVGLSSLSRVVEHLSREKMFVKHGDVGSIPTRYIELDRDSGWISLHLTWLRHIRSWGRVDLQFNLLRVVFLQIENGCKMQKLQWIGWFDLLSDYIFVYCCLALKLIAG